MVKSLTMAHRRHQGATGWVNPVEAEAPCTAQAWDGSWIPLSFCRIPQCTRSWLPARFALIQWKRPEDGHPAPLTCIRKVQPASPAVTHGQWLDVFIGQLAETSIFTLLRGTNSRSKLKQTESAWIIFWVISVAYTTVIKTKTEESQWASHFFMCFEFPRLHLMINSIGKVCAFSFVNLESISESQLNV